MTPWLLLDRNGSFCVHLWIEEKIWDHEKNVIERWSILYVYQTLWLILSSNKKYKGGPNRAENASRSQLMSQDHFQDKKIKKKIVIVFRWKMDN